MRGSRGRGGRLSTAASPSLVSSGALLMLAQRWTLAVVCAATAMLMLDIAVVNTALSDIAADLDTGLSGLQWVVDAYTLALAATVLTAGALADRLGRRRVFLVGLSIFTVTSLGCAMADSHRGAELDARRAGRRRGDHVRRLAGAAGERLSGRQAACRRARRLRRDDRRLVRGRPARRRRSYERARLALDLPRQPADRPRLHRVRRGPTSRSRAIPPRAGSTGRAR